MARPQSTESSDRRGIMKLAEHGETAGYYPLRKGVQLTIAETRSSYRALCWQFSRASSSSRRIVVRRSLERAASTREPESHFTAFSSPCLQGSGAHRIYLLGSQHSYSSRLCVRPFVLRHAEVQCASVPLVPIRAGISTSQPIPRAGHESYREL